MAKKKQVALKAAGQDDQAKKQYKAEEHDKVTFETYKKYIRAAGGYCRFIWSVMFIMLVMCFGQAFQVTIGIWT